MDFHRKKALRIENSYMLGEANNV